MTSDDMTSTARTTGELLRLVEHGAIITIIDAKHGWDQGHHQAPPQLPGRGLSSGSGYTSVECCEATGEDEREGAVMDSKRDLPCPQRPHPEEPAALAEGDRGVLIRMTPEEIQILVLAELPDVPASAGRKPITDCTREDLAFAIDDYYQAAASLSRSAAGQTGLWPDWDRHLARVAAAKAELLELMREQMDKARGAAKVSDLWLGPMEAEFRRGRGHRGE
jgi:hypothetical protein